MPRDPLPENCPKRPGVDTVLGQTGRFLALDSPRRTSADRKTLLAQALLHVGTTDGRGAGRTRSSSSNVSCTGLATWDMTARI